MKRAFVFLLTTFIICSNLNYIAKAKSPAPEVSADSAVLIDATTGTILYSKNMDTSYPPASTTKIMTALLTIENAELTDTVKVGKSVPYVDGSKIGLFEGEELSVKNVLYGLLMLSGNDCAEALAEHVGGTKENFAQLMNKRAQQLGCENTNFVNPSGLYDNNHKTSAKDLALIMREVAKYPEFREIASTYSYKIPPTNKHPEGIPLGNENKLINKGSMYYYPGAEAGKTGYTVQSQHSYVASATRNGQRLIVALVHDKNKTFFPDARNLFDYGFSNFELSTLYKRGDEVSTLSKECLSVPLLAAEDYLYVKEKNTQDKPELNLLKKDLKDLSFKKGDTITEAEMNMKEKTLPKLRLVSGIDHEKKSLFSNEPSADGKSNNKLLIASSLLLALIFLGGFIRAYNIRKRRYRSLYKNK